jgi:hypothetical protein
VRFIFSPEGKSILEKSGLLVLDKPSLGGPERPPEGLF